MIQTHLLSNKPDLLMRGAVSRREGQGALVWPNPIVRVCRLDLLGLWLLKQLNALENLS